MKTLYTVLILSFIALSINAQTFKPLSQGKASLRPAGQAALKMDKIPVMPTQEKVSVDYSQIGGQTFTNSVNRVQHFDKDKGTIWVSGKQKIDKQRSLESQVTDWFSKVNTTIGIDDNVNYQMLSRIEENDGGQHLKYIQVYKNIPVFGNELILHAKEDIIYFINGQATFESEWGNISETPTISDLNAQKIVTDIIPGYTDNWVGLESLLPNDFAPIKNTLVWYTDNDQTYLAYHMVVQANIADKYEYFVNAHTGEIINYWSAVCKLHNHDNDDHECSHHGHLHNSLVKKLPTPANKEGSVMGPEVANARDLLGQTRLINTYEQSNTFFMIDASRDMFNPSQSNIPENPVGVIWTLDIMGQSPINGNATYAQVVSNNNSWTNSPEGVSAHYNAGQSYEYFKNVHGRESISGDGQNIHSIVNVTDEDGSSLGNAFYSSLALWYGNGDATFLPLGRALDVAGHELTHGVVETSANLIYQNESGAMNESFSDIFGVMIDREDWLVGEDAVRPGVFPGGALRNVSDPHNNARTGDFGNGWQPRHVNERFTGSQDNGGVHINSGITNYAFFLFANQVGRSIAERTYYRALTTYLTRQSGFNELRFAVLQSASDLFDNATVNAAATAFDNVGITDGGAPTDFEEDVVINEGIDLLLVSDESFSNLILIDLTEGEVLINPISRTDHISKPSVTDDGSRIVFTGADNHIYLMDLDWSTYPPQFQETQISNSPDWRNAVISKDGNRIAILEASNNNNVIVIDLPTNTENTFQLFNPTYTEGVNVGDVLYADAMEFDISGNVLMYDAINEIRSSNGQNSIQYWDIGFLEVWNPSIDTWALGNIEKLFGSLPEDVSIGNPTFSKNSPFIIAFDVLEGQDFNIFGMNIENSDRNSLFLNTGIGFPNYSRDDRFLVHDLDLFGTDLGILQVNGDKISTIPNTEDILVEGVQWGVWFSNGSRNLPTSTEDIIQAESVIEITPNPAEDFIQLTWTSDEIFQNAYIEMYDITGRQVMNQKVNDSTMILDVSTLQSGSYNVVVRSDNKLTTHTFIKK